MYSLLRCERTSDYSFTHNIQNHNRLFFTLFEDTLNPKFHILTLYPVIKRACGLVRKCWSNFEAKHRSFKMYLYSITSRKNIALSIARKCQQMFTDFLLNQSIKSFWKKSMWVALITLYKYKITNSSRVLENLWKRYTKKY